MKRTLTERSDAIPALAEVFREHGYEGASVALISSASGLGKGSLYNFFPGGKEEMMHAVLADIENWFEKSIFVPLQQAQIVESCLSATFRDVEAYFNHGGRICLVGLIGLSAARDPFARQVARYFSRWITSLAECLCRGGIADRAAHRLAEETVAGIQGGLVLAQALDEAAVFMRAIQHHEKCLLDALAATQPES